MSDWLDGQGDSPAKALQALLANSQKNYATVSAAPDPNLNLNALAGQQSNQSSQFPQPEPGSTTGGGGDTNAALLEAIQGLAQTHSQPQQPQQASAQAQQPAKAGGGPNIYAQQALASSGKTPAAAGAGASGGGGAHMAGGSPSSFMGGAGAFGQPEGGTATSAPSWGGSTLW